ncbi:MAG: response regulator transcription factor [Terracoccus sp.]
MIRLGITMPLTRTLEREGYTVERVASGAAGLERVAQGGVDLIVLDLGLPDMDGLDVCRQVRAGSYRGGILILTARGGELDRVVGLDVGADDYLSKPFGLSELLARVRALLRRTGVIGPGTAHPPAPSPAPEQAAPASRPVEADVTAPTESAAPGNDVAPNTTEAPAPLRVEVSARRVWAHDDEVYLTSKEFDVLALLDSDRGAVFTRERLMDEVWDENWFGSTKTLDVTVGRLRQKLAGTAADIRIVSVRGVGFRLEASPSDA